MATHDYVIDNSTGANVRADINLVLQAILTNNSSSSAPSTTAAYMWWADTTNGVLKIRNSANNGWVELLQLDGTLTLEDGSNSSPALAFRNDLDTGVFSSAANAFNIATAGVERIEFGTTECVVNDPGSNTDFRIEGDTEANLFFLDAGNDRIGIGTNSPSTLLHISDDQSSGGVGFTLHNSNSSAGTTPYCFISAILNPSRNGGEIRFGREGTYGDQNSADSFMAFFTSANDTNTERSRIDSSGRLLIGTSTSKSTSAGQYGLLNIQGGAGTTENFVAFSRNEAASAMSADDEVSNLTFTDSVGYEFARIKVLADAATGTADTPGRLVFLTTPDGASAAQERLRIDKDGNVTITNASANAKLSLVSTGGSGQQFDIRSINSNGRFAIGTASNNHVLLESSNNNVILADNAGNVAIGQTTANFKLDVLGDINFKTSTGVQHPFNFRNDFTPNSFRADLLSTINVTSNNALRVGSVASSGGVTLQGNRANDSSAKVNIILNPDGGNVGVATTSPVAQTTSGGTAITPVLDLKGTGQNNASGVLQLTRKDNTTQGSCIYNSGDDAGLTFRNTDGNGFGFYNGTSIALRINPSSNIMMGTTSVLNTGTVTIKGNGVVPLTCEASATSAFSQILFNNPNGIVGEIRSSGSSTSYMTSSDYRLKENVETLSDGITRLKTLKPYRFNWKTVTGQPKEDGFLAHEVTAVPEAISGTKDEVNSDNKPVYQGIDHSKLVPLLVAAVQELITKVETLEAA